MKVVIAGSRELIQALPLIYYGIGKLCHPKDIKTIISGTARGIDKLGEKWAQQNNVPIERYPADWNKHGRAAGPIRNEEMADICDAAVIVWDGHSNGTKHMISALKKRKKNYVLVKVNDEFEFLPEYTAPPEGPFLMHIKGKLKFYTTNDVTPILDSFTWSPVPWRLLYFTKDAYQGALLEK